MADHGRAQERMDLLDEQLGRRSRLGADPWEGARFQVYGNLGTPAAGQVMVVGRDLPVIADVDTAWAWAKSEEGGSAAAPAAFREQYEMALAKRLGILRRILSRLLTADPPAPQLCTSGGYAIVDRVLMLFDLPHEVSPARVSTATRAIEDNALKEVREVLDVAGR